MSRRVILAAAKKIHYVFCCTSTAENKKYKLEVKWHKAMPCISTHLDFMLVFSWVNNWTRNCYTARRKKKNEKKPFKVLKMARFRDAL